MLCPANARGAYVRTRCGYGLAFYSPTADQRRVCSPRAPTRHKGQVVQGSCCACCGVAQTSESWQRHGRDRHRRADSAPGVKRRNLKKKLRMQDSRFLGAASRLQWQCIDTTNRFQHRHARINMNTVSGPALSRNVCRRVDDDFDARGDVAGLGMWPCAAPVSRAPRAQAVDPRPRLGTPNRPPYELW